MQHSNAAHPYQSYRATRTFQSLDGVRGLCILGVIWHHAGFPLGLAFFDRGFLGVDMFFVLSGFLIVTLLLRERARSGDINLKNFYARRTLRIFPIYYLLLILLSVYYLAAKPGSSMARDYFLSLPFLLTYTTNWVPVQAGNVGITWSLATEEQFYLAWPLIEKLLRPVFVGIVLAVVLVVNQLMNFGAFDRFFAGVYGPGVSLPLLQATFTPIALGVLLAHLLHHPRTFAASHRFLGRRGSCLLLGGLLLSLVAGWPGDISGWGRLFIQLTMTLLLGSLVIRDDHPARPLLTFRPLAYLGVISYGIYLYHMWAISPVRSVFLRLGWKLETLAFFAAAVAASTAAAGLSYRFIERPLLKLKARFSSEAVRVEIEPSPESVSTAAPGLESAS